MSNRDNEIIEAIIKKRGENEMIRKNRVSWILVAYHEKKKVKEEDKNTIHESFK